MDETSRRPPPTATHRRAAPRLIPAASVVLGAALLSGCGATTPAAARAAGPAPTTGPRVTVGDVTVSGATIPDPASPAVAAAYLTVTDHGRRADALVGAAGPAGTSATLHDESDSADGMGTMVPVARVVVPAGGTVALRPGHQHLMIEGLGASLRVGQSVPLALHFSGAGWVRVSARVVPLLGTGGGS